MILNSNNKYNGLNDWILNKLYEEIDNNMLCSKISLFSPDDALWFYLKISFLLIKEGRRERKKGKEK